MSWTHPSRHALFNVAVVAAVLALVYFGAGFVFDWAEETRMDDMRRETTAAAGTWSLEEGASGRFGGRAFLMASANTSLVDGDHFYDVSIICYGPGEKGAWLLVLVYKVAITPHGLGAYPLGAGDRAQLVRRAGGRDRTLALAYDAASEALETRLAGVDPEAIGDLFDARYSEETPLRVRGMDGDVAFVDPSASDHGVRRRVLAACAPGGGRP